MPILAQNKIYIHMPKTGGSWITNCLKSELGAITLSKHHGHASFDQLQPHEKKGRTLWGTIRDPWTWYHSWWRHGIMAGHEKSLSIYGGGSHKFPDVLEGLLSRDPKRCPKNCAVIWSVPKPEKSRNEYLEGDGGLYTWAFFHMYGDQVKTLIDIRRMHEGFMELFSVGTNVDSHPPVNGPGLTKEADKCFSKDQVEDVRNIDDFLISYLGYENPATSISVPVLRL